MNTPSPSPINKPSPLNATAYADIFVAAVEGGINYWAAADDYDWEFVDLSRNINDDDPAKDYARAVITEEDTQNQWEVDSRSELWHDAVAKAAEYFGTSVEDFYEDHDAGSADVAMQFATLGEVIYG